VEGREEKGNGRVEREGKGGSGTPTFWEKVTPMRSGVAPPLFLCVC